MPELHPVFYIFLILLAFLAGIYIGLLLFYYIILFIIYSLDAATSQKYFSPEFMEELKSHRKNFKLKNFLKFIR